MRRAATVRGFSLVEVALAVGLAGGVVAVLLGLLGGLARQRAQAGETQTAAGLAGGITAALEQAAAGGFDGFAGSVPLRTADPAAGWRLVAQRDGSDVRALTEGESPGRDRFFLVAVRRFPAGPLAYQGTSGALALEAVVSWPFQARQPNGVFVETPPDERRQITFNVVLNR